MQIMNSIIKVPELQQVMFAMAQEMEKVAQRRRKLNIRLG